jgi:hypothetical protein
MFGPSSLVCDIWPSSLCGVGEVEPSLRPDRDVVSALGLGLPTTESWGGIVICLCRGRPVFWTRVATRNVVLAGAAAEASASVELYTRKPVECLLHGRCCCAMHLLQHGRSFARHLIMIPTTTTSQGPRTPHRLRPPHRHGI